MLRAYQEAILRLKFRASYLLKLIEWGLSAQIVAFAIAIFALRPYVNFNDLLTVKSWIFAEIKNIILMFFHSQTATIDNSLVAGAIKNILYEIRLPIALSFLGWIVPLIVHLHFKKRGGDYIKEEQLEGSKLIDVLSFIKKIKRSKKPTNLQIGGFKKGNMLLQEDKTNDKEEKILRKGVVPIPIEDEIKHFLIVGAPGSGKSVLLKPVIDQIKTRDEKMIIHDFKGDMLTKFYNPLTDFIFNPLDERCLGWNIWNDIKNELDISSIAASLFVATNKEDPFWNDAARDVFEAVMIYLYKNDKKTNKDIWEYLNKPAKELQEILKSDTDTYMAARYIEQSESKQTQGVLSKLSQNTQFFKYLKNIDGNFSIKEFINSDEIKGSIFLINYADLKDVLTPAITLFIDIASKATLSIEDNLSRRVFFMLDEFGQLRKMTSLIDILTNGRSKGVSVWLAIQDIGQIEDKYGSALKQTIINTFSNLIIFRLNDPKTAKFFIEKIGERKMLLTDEMIHHRADGETDQMQVRKSQRVESLLLNSNLLNLESRKAYISLASIEEYTKIKVYVKQFENVANR